MTFYSSRQMLNTNESCEIVKCIWCGEYPEVVAGSHVECKGCGTKIVNEDTCEAIMSWNRANSPLADILKSFERMA